MQGCVRRVRGQCEASPILRAPNPAYHPLSPPARCHKNCSVAYLCPSWCQWPEERHVVHWPRIQIVVVVFPLHLLPPFQSIIAHLRAFSIIGYCSVEPLSTRSQPIFLVSAFLVDFFSPLASLSFPLLSFGRLYHTRSN